MTIDVQTVRADTPGCAEVIHLNNSGASLMPAPVRDAVIGYLHREARRGGYETYADMETRLEGVHDSVAALVGSDRGEIAVVENATRAWDMAFYGLGLSEGDRILTTTTEYASNYLAYLQVARRAGVVVEVVPDTDHGEVDVAALESMLDERVALISMNHMPSQGGLVNPAAEIGDVARRNGVPYLLDACQTVGQMPIDVSAIGCDMLSGTSRKFLRGPRGVGFLYVRSGFLPALDPPFLDLHAAEWTGPGTFELRDDARRFETWEANFAGKLGFGVAVDYAMEVGLDDIWERVSRLAAQLRDRLVAVPGVEVRDRGSLQGAIVSFTVEGVEPDRVRTAARSGGINVSVTTPASAQLDMERSVVRSAPHYFNTEAELDALVDVVAKVASTV